METELHYSPTALVRRTGGMVIAATVVIIDFTVHANGGFPRMFGLSFVSSATLIATALYLVGVTMVLTLGLIRQGGVAFARTSEGLTIHTAWFSKTLAWADLSRVALEVHYTKAGHYTAVAVHERSGMVRCHVVDVRLITEAVDKVDSWVADAERSRVAHGGAPYVAPTSGLAGYNARHSADDLAAEIATARTIKVA